MIIQKTRIIRKLLEISITKPCKTRTMIIVLRCVLRKNLMQVYLGEWRIKMSKAKHQREKIIELHDKQGMTFPEIAKTLNMSLSTTYNVYRYGNGHGKKDIRYRETVRVPQKRLFVYKGKAYWDITDYFMGV